MPPCFLGKQLDCTSVWLHSRQWNEWKLWPPSWAFKTTPCIFSLSFLPSPVEKRKFWCPRGQHRRRQWHPTPVQLPGKSHGRRSLVDSSPWGLSESGTTERLHFHCSLSCIGEGNGNPPHCSCLENSKDRGPSGLLSMGSHRIGHDWSDLAAAAAAAAAATSLFLNLLIALYSSQ